MRDEFIIIKQHLKDNKISYQKLSEMSNVPLNTLKNIFSGKTKNPTFETMQAILNALNISFAPPIIDDKYAIFYSSLPPIQQANLLLLIGMFNALPTNKQDICFELIKTTLETLNKN